MGRLGSTVAALALLGAAVLLVLGMGEVVLRLFPQLLSEEDRLRVHWREVNAHEVSQGDPYLGFRFPADYQGRFERDGEEFAFTYTTDRHGFRNSRPWPERADIVVLGDSMAFGYGVEDDQTWTALLGQRLPGTQIVNLGLVGGAPQQYERIYERFGQDLEPGIVLFCLFPGNDLGDAGRFDQWLQAGSEGNYRLWRPDGDHRTLWSLLGRSYLASFLRSVPPRLGSRLSGRTIDFPDGGRLQLAPSIYRGNEILAQRDHPYFRLVVDAVARTRARAERNGSRFLVLLVPTKEEVYLPLLDEQPPPGTAPLAAYFSETGVPHLDLTPHFQAAARAGEQLFFEVDGHPNAAGYRLMAEVVLEHLGGRARGAKFAHIPPADTAAGSDPAPAPSSRRDQATRNPGQI
jgi:lysophospholipase L1-like esterase